MNIVDPILFQASVQPMSAAICCPGSGTGLISYGRLAMLIANISRALRRLGLSRGKTVAIGVKDEIFGAAIMLALARLGIASLRYDERTPAAVKIDALIADVYPPKSTVDQIILADRSWIEGDAGPLQPHEFPQTSPDDICRIALTSGSTGTPKAVALTHRMMSERVRRLLTIFGAPFARCSRIYCDMPISTAYGYQIFLYTLYRGGLFIATGDTFARTVAAFEEYQAQCWAGTPGGLEVHLKWFEQTPALRSSFGFVLCGGDKLSRSLADRVRARMCSNMVAAYGSSEAAGTASAPVRLISDSPNAVGFVNPGVTVEIVNDAGLVLPAGAEGHVRIKNSCAVDHYVGDAEASAKAFRDGWFYPGDIGSLSADNVLHIRGREDSLLNLGGDKISPDFIERTLAACDGVTDCAVFGSRNELGVEEVWALVVASGQVDDARLRKHCEANLSRGLIPVRFVRVAKIPRNDMEKINRAALPALATSSMREPS